MSPDHDFDEGAPTTETTVDAVDWSTYGNPATAVADAVADATDRDQIDLEPLQYTIDADALNRLFDETSADELAVSFTYEGVEVRVSKQFVEVWQ